MKEDKDIQEQENQEVKEVNFEEEIAKLNAEINEWKKEYAIKLADFENYKKRKDKEFDEFKKYACEDLIVKQLADMDILTRAVQSTNITDDNQNIITGINMVINNMMNNLISSGVEEIVAEGIYDPYIHQAMLTDNITEEEDGKILEVLQKGYRLKGKVIRPSMVKINKR